jgi:plasmid stabilization system protein ParE
VNFRVEPAARLEFVEGVRWYLDEAGVDQAERFDQAVSKAVTLLCRMPGLGTPLFGTLKAWPLRRFPFTLIYRVEREELVIVALAHQNRDPGYWRHRS